MPRNSIRTKIIATLGPASSTREQIAALVDAGVDVFRFNFSHGTLAEHAERLHIVRELARESGRPLAVLGDLCGPKIRLNAVRGAPVELHRGQTVRFVRGEGECTADTLTTSYPAFVDDVQLGQRIYIDDGVIRLLVTDRGASGLVCSCTAGGVISSRKGINLPDTRLPVPALTEKDRRDLDWAIEHGLDYVALSFVRRPEDVAELRDILKQRGSDIGVVAKIEKVEALEHLDGLIAASDAVLVARGDLGVETDVWRVPLIQKEITARCRAAGVPVIIATQMLQSMVTSPMPTRAEVSDVANAVLDAADAVMLSAETATGQYSVRAVDVMDRVIEVTEEFLARRPPCETAPSVSTALREHSAIAHAAVQAARDLNARLVAAWTATGATVRLLAAHRLHVPVVGLTDDERVCRRMNLLYGVIPLRVEPTSNPAEMAAVLDARLLERGLAAPGDRIVVVTSTRPRTPGATDTTLVHRVGVRG